MKESAQAAVSWVRAHAAELGIAPDFWMRSDLHLHVPAGAIPKDGPSAGVTLATALVSLLRGQSIRPGLAMTGEITLSGRVLPVGGIKEKVLAAHRAGLTTLILPRQNERQLLEDVPAEVRAQLEVHLVRDVAEVLHIALPDASRWSALDAELELELVGKGHVLTGRCGRWIDTPETGSVDWRPVSAPMARLVPVCVSLLSLAVAAEPRGGRLDLPVRG